MEIIVVLAIMAVVAATVAPAMLRSDTTGPLASSAGDVERVLRAARNSALERAMPVTVAFVPESRAYAVEADSDGTPTMLAQGILAFAPGTSMSSDRPRVRFVFGRLGVTDPDSVAIVGDAGSAVVGVDRWTGEVHVRIAGR